VMNSPFSSVLRLCFVACAALYAVVLPARAVQIDALVGYGFKPETTKFRSNSLTPLTVFLSGQGVKGVGQMQVTVQNGSENTVYTRRVPLNDGNLNEIQRFTLDLRKGDSYNSYRGGGQSPTIGIQLLVDGRKVAEKSIKMAYGSDENSFNVLSLTRDGSGMNFLLRKKMGLVHRGIDPNTNRGYQPSNASRATPSAINVNGSLLVYTTDPRALPGMAQGYDAIDAVVLGDLPFDTLAESQLSAIKLYVRQGGLLVVSGGSDLTRLRHPFLAELLPVNPGSPRTLTLDALTSRYRAPLGSGSVGAITGTLKSGAEALFSDGNTALVASRAYGSGKVVYLPFDALSPELRGWQGAQPFWRDVLRSGNRYVSPSLVLASNNTPYGSSASLADALAGKQATNAPALSLVGGFIGLYILLLVPVSYVILKKLDKRELSWVTAPILILGFSGVSYAIASNIKGGMLTVNSAVVYEGFANSDTLGGYGRMTLYSPKRAEYDISIGAPTDQTAYSDIAPSEVQNSVYNNAVNTLTIAHDKTTTLKNTAVRLWDKRSFEMPVVESLGGGIQAKVTMRNANIAEITVTNKTKYTLRHCAIAYSDQVAQIGELKPNQSQTKTLRVAGVGKNWQVGVSVPAMSGDAFNTKAGKVRPEVTRRFIESSLASAVGQRGSNNQYYGGSVSSGYGLTTPIFTGWFDEPTLDVRVNGAKPEGVQVGLVYINLPIPKNAPNALTVKANPFMQKPVLDLPDGSRGDFQP